MTREECLNAPKYAGIYYFKNKINGKYYIGQAVKLRKRLLSHINNYHGDRYSHLAIYKAFKKYGLENFELGILDTFTEALTKETKAKLDVLEKKYIQQYNSYGATGYNATLGGDAGVLGLIQSKEVIKKIKEGSLQSRALRDQNSDNWVIALNLENGFSHTSINTMVLAKSIGSHHSAISRCLKGKQRSILGKWVIFRYSEGIPEELKTKEGRQKLLYSITNKKGFNQQRYLGEINYHSLKEVVKKILEENPYVTATDAKNLYNINKNTFLRYRKELNKVPEQRVDVKVPKEVFLDYIQNHSKEETLKHFNIKSSLYSKYLKKYESRDRIIKRTS